MSDKQSPSNAATGTPAPPAAAPPAPPPPAPAAPPPAPPAPKLIEVQLDRKYCPHFLIEDGKPVANNEMVKKTIEPGVVMLHEQDAGHVLNNGIARATMNTFKGLGG